ncbi:MULTISPECIES: AarF/UbiB family protein [unclassified Microbacterium]|uniref:ABC1 kinase family protein n=1 Tax=unclassified Microbacterium TaxID=2609290 RepID=UPI0024692012|nr:MULTISPECIES: AarF/UbiB family protein [unclassified Microbacterium]MDH5131820.1 AarF/UbiB family protein [Microbacterium sp. RD10]MDH5135625.1 AarF/UbiB family protein [Microbacterium sp. RD11]MDH5145199.1 AarF/UbiB family protein [Microbacterium sp. RD12]MDH5153660.1 AarF/UbiB family protein [Microbacterium sp. RD06]MDH5165922.1 AarF/UbiB family protein [Microbacterium sp. RD02]
MTAAAAQGPHRARYRRILSFASREFVAIWWFELVLPRFGLRGVAERTRARRMQRFARRFHALAVDLGGLMIKVGQFMSSRLDVLPPEITAELEGLQDEVPAVPTPQIRALAEAELGMPLERVYTWFDDTPVAAASLGQVHRARLSSLDAEDTGLDEVVVKVQRPGIDEIVAVDLAALRRVARWLTRVRIVADRVDAPALVEEFAVTSLEEIDYLHEARSAERFRENFADDPRVAAPEIVWERTTRRVLTLSDVTAIKINDTAALRAAGIDPSAVADAFAEVMFDQVFTHRFVHADPHPGNIFVTPVPSASSGTQGGFRLTFIDFGMMAEVSDNLRQGLRTLLIAVTARDSRGLVRAAKEIGVLLPTADTGELERALTALFARFGGMGFAELSRVDPREFTDFAEEFGDMVRRLPLQLPEDMLLLIRAVSLTSGMCSALNPAFNVWDAAEPYAARLLRDESGTLMQDMAEQAMANAATTWRLPKRIDDIITRVDDGNVSFDTSRLERRLDRLEGIARRIASGALFAAMLVGGALLVDPLPPLGITLLWVSVLPLLGALFLGRRRPR